MKKETIAAFFDQCAPWWDADMIRKEDIISKILDNGGIQAGVHVLDVACGTGVLFPDYLQRGVASVTGIDISPEMVKIAASKFPQVSVLCADVEEATFDRQFDCIMVYNAFPHFPSPHRLIKTLAGLVKPGGRLSVAHSMSRAELANHHAGRASEVSIDLIDEQQLAELFSQWFDVDVVISDDRMYQVAGTRRCDDTDNDRESMTELTMLLKYMVGHNDAHAQELAELAEKLKESGNRQAYDEIMDAISYFDVANARLASVLDDLMKE